MNDDNNSSNSKKGIWDLRGLGSTGRELRCQVMFDGVMPSMFV